MYRVVFICTGNMCRSPIAEVLLREKCANLGRNDIFVTSSGTHARADKPAAALAVEVCQENGIDLTRHLSQPLNPRALESCDIIFTMEMVQKNFITLFFPDLQDRVVLLGSWPNKDSKKGYIPDPIGGNIKDFRKTFQTLQIHVDRILPSLLARFPGPR